ncbi:MAG: HNH endonuclease [Firmicutes bacterium]|nr:HNH endonuclease [Bacillota bacterium]MDH7495305.1 HNH endonuclease signature motif containing protein [Bacillota bacterium]
MCGTKYDNRYLQIDHRVPYEVGGDESTTEDSLEPFMLLCGACNRRKSWSCEHCDNWRKTKDPKLCRTCYWGSPESYTHVALRRIRQLIIAWLEDEVDEYDAIAARAEKEGIPVPELIKQLLAQTLNRHA